jgi:predicted RNA-binding protein with TRAM domain
VGGVAFSDARREKDTSYRKGHAPRSYGVRAPSGPKPVAVGEEYDVSISDISRRGDGIAKIEGFIIFVPGAKTGQRLRIKVVEVANRFARAQIVEGVSEKGTETE